MSPITRNEYRYRIDFEARECGSVRDRRSVLRSEHLHLALEKLPMDG